MEDPIQAPQPTQPTQPSTQPYNDPRRMGRNNSGMSDEDMTDVICILHPMNALALDAVRAMMKTNPEHVLQNDDLMDGFDPDDLQTNLMMQSTRLDRDLALRMSSKLKDPSIGFTFGRNIARCDILLTPDNDKNISNIHFSISVNENGIIMLEDRSTNGTIVEGGLYGKATGKSTIMLSPNTTISVFCASKQTVNFMVRYPNRGEYSEAYNERLRGYITKRPGMENTIIPSVSNYDSTFGMHWNGGEEFNVVGHLGKGAFATVYKLATKRDGKLYAAKELDKRRFMKNGILDLKVDNEMKIMAALRHPNIVQYEGYHEHQYWIYIVMEFVPGGELSSHVNRSGPIPEYIGKDITRQILHALDYLHKRNITHRDIKPDNILISNLQPLTVKLSDFGLSKCVTDQETFLKTFCGTLLYCAPEVYPDYSNFRSNLLRTKRRRGEPPSKTSPYSQAVDMWSFGAVLYHILCNKPPIMGKGDDRGIHMLNSIMTKDVNYDPLRSIGVSEQGIDFINRLLNRDPEMRPTEKQCFEHEWISNVPDHVDYSGIDDDLPSGYEGLATVNELEEDIWDEDEPDQLVDNRQENVIPTAANAAVGEFFDRTDPRYQSKRQRLRGGGSPEPEIDPVQYPSLPNLDSTPPTKSPSANRGQRLFGEISQSALQSSGLFGKAEGGGADVPTLQKSMENIKVNELVNAPDGSMGSENSSGTDEQYPNLALAAPAHFSAAPSLFGAESDLRGLNMASPEAYQSEGVTPETGNPDTPGTREVTPADTEPLHQVNIKKMAPPPLPAVPRRKSFSKVEATQPSAPPARLTSTIPDTMVNTDGESHKENQNPIEETEASPPSDAAGIIAPDHKAKPGSQNNAAQNSQPPAQLSGKIPPALSVAPDVLDLSMSLADRLPTRLGRIFTTPGSIISADIPITSIRTVYGRGIDSTIKYPDVYDSRIPKYGLKLTFHGVEHSDVASYLREGNAFADITDLYVSITTSATRGIYVNDIHLPNQDTKNDGWYWGQIQSGDIITLYEGQDGNGVREYLRFQVEINYGQSASLRHDDTFTVMWSPKKTTSSRNGHQ